MLGKSVNFDRAADYYDATRGFPEGVAPQIGAFIAEKLGFNQQTRLLEVGIGTGRIALPLAPYIGNITGLDISTQMMGKLLEKQADEPIELLVADAHQMPFNANSFDATYITHVLHLVADPQQVLREIRRVTRPGQPFVHMRNKRGTTSAAMQKVIDAWNAKTEHIVKRSVEWDGIDNVVTAVGYTKQAEHLLEFPTTVRVRDFFERVEKRQWSSTWRVDDATWQEGLAAVHAAIDEHLDGNRDYETEQMGGFVVQVYTAQ